MEAARSAAKALWRGEQGFTLPEVLTTVVVMGIVLAIASSTWFGVVERRQVDSATNQLTADMRLANTNATNKLSTWGIVLLPDRAAPSAGPDYYLVKFTSSGSVDTSTTPVPRTLPDNTKVMNDAPALNDSAAVVALYSVLTVPGVAAPSTSRTLKFNTDGSMQYPASGTPGADTVKVTNDGSPVGKITSVSQTSRVRADVG